MNGILQVLAGIGLGVAICVMGIAYEEIKGRCTK